MSSFQVGHGAQVAGAVIGGGLEGLELGVAGVDAVPDPGGPVAGHHHQRRQVQEFGVDGGGPVRHGQFELLADQADGPEHPHPVIQQASVDGPVGAVEADVFERRVFLAHER